MLERGLKKRSLHDEDSGKKDFTQYLVMNVEGSNRPGMPKIITFCKDLLLLTMQSTVRICSLQLSACVADLPFSENLDIAIILEDVMPWSIGHAAQLEHI